MDHPDYKYQPRRKKMKNIGVTGTSEDEKPIHARKACRRSKKRELQSEEIDDNGSSDKGFSGCTSYSNYDNRSKEAYAMPNYNGISAFSSYMPPVTQETASYSSYDNDYYSRKYESMEHAKTANSPDPSSHGEHSMTPPETSISSAISTASASAATPNGNFRELSPSLIASHSIMKEDFAVTAPSDCAYRSNLDSSSTAIAAPFNKDISLISKYNQESYRIYSHQMHHHHHFHYALQSPSQSPPPSTAAYPYQYSTPIDTDEVSPDEMEQYLECGKYRKLCYFKPEGSLTELAPMNPVPSVDNQLLTSPMKTGDGAVSVNDTIIAPNQPINSAYAVNNYQDSTTASYQYMSNWVNYNI